MAVILCADRVEQFDLGFEEVDMAFLIRDQILEQVLADVIADLVTVIARLDIQRACVMFAGQVRFQRFLEVLADPQRVLRSAEARW